MKKKEKIDLQVEKSDGTILEKRRKKSLKKILDGWIMDSGCEMKKWFWRRIWYKSLDRKECDYKLCTVEDTNSKQVCCLNSSLLECAPATQAN
jgi:hypothetical protein